MEVFGFEWLAELILLVVLFLHIYTLRRTYILERRLFEIERRLLSLWKKR